jgi:hypothetical protein
MLVLACLSTSAVAGSAEGRKSTHHPIMNVYLQRARRLGRSRNEQPSRVPGQGPWSPSLDGLGSGAARRFRIAARTRSPSSQWARSSSVSTSNRGTGVG